MKTEPGRTLPFADAAFDAVASISVFAHMNERDQFFYLDELRRVTSAGAMLFLTVFGTRVMDTVSRKFLIRFASGRSCT